MEASLLRKHMVRLPVVHRSYPGTCCCFFPRREAPRSVLSCPFPGHMRTRLHPPTPATTLGLPLPAPTSLLGRSPSIAAPHPHPPRPSPERSPRCLPSTPSMNDELKMQEGGRSSSAIVKGESAGGGGRDAEGGSVVGLAQATQSHSRALRVPHPRARLPNSVQRDPRSLARHCLHRGLAAPRVHRGPSEKGGRESYSLLPPAASPLAAPPSPHHRAHPASLTAPAAAVDVAPRIQFARAAGGGESKQRTKEPSQTCGGKRGDGEGIFSPKTWGLLRGFAPQHPRERRLP